MDTDIHIPHSWVLGHCFGVGSLSALQLDVLQATMPVPALAAVTPHFVAHPVGSVRIHVPKEWDVVNNGGGGGGIKAKTRNY